MYLLLQNTSNVYVGHISGKGQQHVRPGMRKWHGGGKSGFSGGESGFGGRKSDIVTLLTWEDFWQVLTFQQVCKGRLERFLAENDDKSSLCPKITASP
jgi:hypothetical protein